MPHDIWDFNLQKKNQAILKQIKKKKFTEIQQKKINCAQYLSHLPLSATTNSFLFLDITKAMIIISTL